jgi:predicted MFS family arabinose efflux permease
MRNRAGEARAAGEPTAPEAGAPRLDHANHVALQKPVAMVRRMDSPSASATRYGIAGMIAMAVAMGIGRFVYTPILPGMMESLGLSASDAGSIASANYLGYLVGAIAAAFGWAHRRERAMLLVGLIANAILAAAMACTASLPAFLLIRFAAGVASAFVMVFAVTIVFSHLAAAGRDDLQALHFGGVGLGIAVSALLVGSLHLAGGDWAVGWVGAGVLSLAGFLVAAVLIREGPLSAGAGDREPRLPRSMALAKITAAYGIFGFGYIITATFLVAIVRQGEGGPLFEAAVWLVTGIAGFPSVYLWKPVVARLGNMRTFALGCVVEGIGVVASVKLGSYAGPLIGGVLLGGTFIALTTIGLVAGRAIAAQSPRRALAVMTAFFGVGQIVGPVVAGFLADRTGSFTAPSIGAAAALLLCALIALSVGDISEQGRRH